MATATRSRPSIREWICGRITDGAGLRSSVAGPFHSYCHHRSRHRAGGVDCARRRARPPRPQSHRSHHASHRGLDDPPAARHAGGLAAAAPDRLERIDPVINQGFPIQGFAIRYVWKDIVKRPYITVGFSAFLLLIPLAWTSTRGWVRRLGKRWTTLHQAIYVAAALATLHFLWLVKGKQMKPVYYALVLIGLLALRVVLARRRGDWRSTPVPPREVTPLPSPSPGSS